MTRGGRISTASRGDSATRTIDFVHDGHDLRPYWSEPRRAGPPVVHKTRTGVDLGVVAWRVRVTVNLVPQEVSIGQLRTAVSDGSFLRTRLSLKQRIEPHTTHGPCETRDFARTSNATRR